MPEPRELVLLTRAERMLAEARDIDTVRDLRDKAQAAKAWAKKAGVSKKIILHAATIKVQAERRLGEMLQELPLAKAAPGNQYRAKTLDRSQTATGPVRLQDLGITKSDSSRAQQIARLPAATFHRYVERTVKAGQEPTSAGLLRLAKEQNAQTTATPRGNPGPRVIHSLQSLVKAGRRFGTIYADPPWSFHDRASRGAANNHYPTMTLRQILMEPVAGLAAEASHLHLWCPSAILPDALQVVAAWGFEYRSTFVWVKPQLGVGHYWRCSHEILLLAIRGNLPFRDHSQRSWIQADRRRHSEKPDEVRTLIEKVSPGPYLELYGRVVPDNPDWTVYGNQVKSGR